MLPLSATTTGPTLAFCFLIGSGMTIVKGEVEEVRCYCDVPECVDERVCRSGAGICTAERTEEGRWHHACIEMFSHGYDRLSDPTTECRHGSEDTEKVWKRYNDTAGRPLRCHCTRNMCNYNHPESSNHNHNYVITGHRNNSFLREWGSDRVIMMALVMPLAGGAAALLLTAVRLLRGRHSTSSIKPAPQGLPKSHSWAVFSPRRTGSQVIVRSYRSMGNILSPKLGAPADWNTLSPAPSIDSDCSKEKYFVFDV